MATTTHPLTPDSDLLAEQLDEQLAAARVKQEEDLAAHDALEKRERADGREMARIHLIDALKAKLGITVPIARVELVEEECDENRYDGGVFAEVQIGGKRFSYRRANRWTSDTHRELVVLRRCTKGCLYPLWIDIESAGELLIALEDGEMQHHNWPCRVEYDDNGDPTTNDWGIPLPKRQPDVDWSARHREATKAFQTAVSNRRELEFTRPIAKAVAVDRIMHDRNISATAAEKLVETDDIYANHCRQVTQAVVDEIEAREMLTIARYHAGYQIELEGEAQ